MIRDFGNRRVSYSDARVIRRRRARAFQSGPVPKRHICSLWPRLVPYTCLVCRQEQIGDPRRGGCGPTHDPDVCAYRHRHDRIRRSVR